MARIRHLQQLWHEKHMDCVFNDICSIRCCAHVNRQGEPRLVPFARADGLYKLHMAIDVQAVSSGVFQPDSTAPGAKGVQVRISSRLGRCSRAPYEVEAGVHLVLTSVNTH